MPVWIVLGVVNCQSWQRSRKDALCWFMVIQGHEIWHQSTGHIMRLPISG